MKEKFKDIFKRTAKTFIQGFVGALPVTLSVAQLGDEAYIKALLIGALAGGICAVWNSLIIVVNKYIEKFKNIA